MLLTFSAPPIQYDDIADEVANMSPDEQDAVHGDLYGERPLVRENEEMIQNALEELDECIESIDSQKEAYETAQIICPEYVNSRFFRLMFLQCERFDCTKAANKMVAYWEKKVDVWGDERAFRCLTIDDFDEEDQLALTMGGYKILPELDDAGRGIIFSHRSLWDNRRTHRNSMLRLFWYMAEAALEDINVQRNGIIFIRYGMRHDDHLNPDAKFHRILVNMIRHCLPIRVVAIHHIISSSVLKLVSENFLYWLGPQWRARYKQHSGVMDEYLESLATYGIVPSMLPQVVGGELEFDYEEWLNNRRARGR